MKSIRWSSFVSVLLASLFCISFASSGHAQPRASIDTSPETLRDGDGSCGSYNSDYNFRNGDNCKNAAGDYSINSNDLGGSITSSYAAIGDDGGTGYVDYSWTPPGNLESLDLRIRGAVKDNSSGYITIKLWDGSSYQTIRREYNSDYGEYSYSTINITIKNDDFIDGGYFAVQFVTDDGWWIDDVKSTWVEAEPQIYTNTTALDYGTVDIGNSETKTVRVENTGDATLTGSAQVDGTDSDQFQITNGASFSLDPGQTYDYSVEYSPDEAANHDASVIIDHNDPNQSSVVVSLDGSGEGDPALSVSPGEGSYSLGDVTVGQSKTQSFTVENTGNGTLSAEPSLTGSDTDQFTITNGGSLSLDPGQDYTLDVEYAPSETGTHQVDLEITHNAPNTGSPWTATLSGEGKPQLATLDLRVENVSWGSSTVPKSNGVVKLYDGNGTLIDEKTTTAVEDGTGAGKVTFGDLDPRKSYTGQIYHDSQKSALNITEYWGKKTNISLSGGDTKNVTFTRYQPFLAGLEVFNQDGTKVTGGTVEPGTPLTVKVTVQNDGSAQSVQPRLVLDRDKQKDSQGDFDFDQTASSSSIATGTQETFSFSWTPQQEGDVYRTYVINGFTPSGSGPTGSGGWWDQPLVTVEANRKPTASVDLQTQPSSMFPGRTYTLETLYSDENGTSDVERVDLFLDHPDGGNDTIHLRKDIDGTVEVRAGGQYLDSYGANVIDLASNTEGRISWQFTFKFANKTNWSPVSEREIAFEVKATDQSGQSSGRSESSVKASYRNYGTTVLTHGLQSPSIDDKLSKWLIDAGCRILQAAGGGKIRIYDKLDGQFESPSEFDTSSDSFFEHADDCATALPSTGEKIFIFYWDKDSNNLGLGYSESAASALFAALKEHEEVESELGPVHLIGHSRGTAVMSEVAERFSVIGEDVEHVTLLDPHDWGADPGKINFLDITTGELILNDYDVNPDMGIGYPDGIPYTDVMGKSVKSNGVVGWKGSEWVEAYWQRNGDDDAVASKSYSYNNCYSSFWGPELNGRPVRGAYNEEWSSFEESCPDGGSQKLNHSGIYREYIRSIEGSSTAPGGYEYSRIGGYAHDRPSRTNDGTPLSAEFSFANLGRGIVNGDFVRGAETGGDPECEQPEGCVPGWTHHGGGGTDGSGRAELVNSENDRALVLGYTEFQYDDDTYVTNSPPAKSLRRTDRFYIPERANRIGIRYKINHPPETGPVLGGGAESPDQFRIDIGQKGSFTQVFQASESEGPHDTFQTARIQLTSAQKGSVQQLRLRVTNDDGKVGSAVLVDNVRIGTNSDPLPVELASFTPQVDRNVVSLQWETASETNNAGFEVQHRADSTAGWEELGFVESKASGGTTTQTQEYRFETGQLDVGSHQFRLRQIDTDGTSHLSDPVKAKVSMREAYRLNTFPNPTRRQATIEIAVREEQNVQLMLYDVLGRRVATLHDGPMLAQETKTLTLNTRQEGLSSGTYFLRLVGKEGTRTSQLTVVR